MSDMKAFPSVIQYFPNDLNADEEKGMTLRDYFAGKAIPSVMAKWPNGHPNGWDGIATAAYMLADAMLKARGTK